MNQPHIPLINNPEHCLIEIICIYIRRKCNVQMPSIGVRKHIKTQNMTLCVRDLTVHATNVRISNNIIS